MHLISGTRGNSNTRFVSFSFTIRICHAFAFIRFFTLLTCNEISNSSTRPYSMHVQPVLQIIFSLLLFHWIQLYKIYASRQIYSYTKPDSVWQVWCPHVILQHLSLLRLFLGSGLQYCLGQHRGQTERHTQTDTLRIRSQK